MQTITKIALFILLTASAACQGNAASQWLQKNSHIPTGLACGASWIYTGYTGIKYFAQNQRLPLSSKRLWASGIITGLLLNRTVDLYQENSRRAEEEKRIADHGTPQASLGNMQKHVTTSTYIAGTIAAASWLVANRYLPQRTTPLQKLAQWSLSAGCAAFLGSYINQKLVDRNPDAALFLAITTGNTSAARTAINNGADVNKAYEPEGNRPLHLAIVHKRLAIIPLLLERPELKINQPNKHGMTPLHLAAAYHKNEDATALIQLLLQPRAGAQHQILIDRQRDDKRDKIYCKGLTRTICTHNAFEAAWENENYDAFVLLLEKDDLIEHSAENKQHYYFQSAKRGVVKILKTIPPEDIVKMRDEKGRTLLHCAAACGSHEAVAYLLKIPGIDVNAASDSGNRPLIDAIRGNFGAIDFKRVDAPCSPKLSLEAFSTQQEAQQKEGYRKTIQLLLAAPGIDVNVKDYWTNLPALHYAVACCDEELSPLLLQHGADPNTIVRYCNHNTDRDEEFDAYTILNAYRLPEEPAERKNALEKCQRLKELLTESYRARVAQITETLEWTDANESGTGKLPAPVTGIIASFLEPAAPQPAPVGAPQSLEAPESKTS